MTEQEQIVALVRHVLACEEVKPPADVYREPAPEGPRLAKGLVRVVQGFAREDRNLMCRSFVQYMRTHRWRVRLRRDLAVEIRYHATNAQRHADLAARWA